MVDSSFFGTVTTDLLRSIAIKVEGADKHNGTCLIAATGCSSSKQLVDSNTIFARLANDRYNTIIIDFAHYLNDDADMHLSDVTNDAGLLERPRFRGVFNVRVLGVKCGRTHSWLPLDQTEANAVGDIIRRLGKKLIRLELSVPAADHAAQWGTMCPQLLELNCEAQDLQQLLPLWHQVKELRRLELNAEDPSAWPATINAMEQHCRKLTHIELYFPASCDELSPDDFVAFVKSYGAQLRLVALRTLPPHLCTDVVRSCPNVRVRYFEWEHDFKSVAAFGDHLDEVVLSISDPRVVYDTNSLRAAMASCRHLNFLEVYTGINSVGVDVWEAFFSAPMRNLRELSLFVVDSSLHVCELISASAQDIRKLTLFFDIIADAEWLKTLVRANPRLEALSVFETLRDEKSDEKHVVLAALLKELHPCRRLQTVRIKLESIMHPLGAFQDILVPWRLRGVKVNVECIDRYVEADGGGDVKFFIVS